MATVTKQTQNVPVVTAYKEETTVTLKLTEEEATELRTVVSDMHVDTTFTHINAIRRALAGQGIHYNAGLVQGRLTKRHAKSGCPADEDQFYRVAKNDSGSSSPAANQCSPGMPYSLPTQKGCEGLMATATRETRTATATRETRTVPVTEQKQETTILISMTPAEAQTLRNVLGCVVSDSNGGINSLRVALNSAGFYVQYGKFRGAINPA